VLALRVHVQLALRRFTLGNVEPSLLSVGASSDAAAWVHSAVANPGRLQVPSCRLRHVVCTIPSRPHDMLVPACFLYTTLVYPSDAIRP
jgi:hypothetical protein